MKTILDGSLLNLVVILYYKYIHSVTVNQVFYSGGIVPATKGTFIREVTTLAP